jgi:hypothetical protein
MRTQRLVAATGAIYVAAVMIGNALATAGQGNVESGSAVLRELRHRTPVQSFGVALEVVSFSALVLFLGYLYRVLRRAEGPDGWGAAGAFGAGLLATAVKLASAGAGLAALVRADQLTPDLARTLSDLGGGAFVVSGYVFGIFVAVAAGAALGSDALPRWLTITGLVVGVLTVAAGVAGVLDPVGYVPVPFLLSLAWLFVTSILLTVRGGPQGAAAGHRAADTVPAAATATA